MHQISLTKYLLIITWYMNKFHCGKKFDDLTFENKEIKTIAIQFPPKSCNSNFTIVLPHAHK